MGPSKYGVYNSLIATRRLRISRHPVYGDLLRLGKEHGGILLDIGCCCKLLVVLRTCSTVCLTYLVKVGNDARKAVSDGYPVDKVIASDLEPGK